MERSPRFGSSSLFVLVGQPRDDNEVQLVLMIESRTRLGVMQKEPKMKIKSLVLATSLALVPATSALAIDKEALKKAKEAAKEKALEKAKEKSEAKTEKAIEKKKDAKEAADEAKAAAADLEKQMHGKHLGLIERLEQIASSTNNTELTATVAKLKDKEAKRHALASGEA
jgi:hypothetical protein